VLMSTHTLEVAQAMCDRIAIIQEGNIVARGTIDELRRQTAAGDASLEELFLKLTGGESVRELAEILDDGEIRTRMPDAKSPTEFDRAPGR